MNAADWAAGWAADWGGAERILCIRLDALGDVLMTTPALAALKRSRRGRHITLLTSGAGAAAAPLLPMVDETIVYDPPWMKATPARETSALDRTLIARLRGGGFDAAVIFTVYSQSPLPAALLCYLADIPLRLAHARENPYRLLTNWIAEPEPQQFVRHEAQRQIDLVASVGARIEDVRLSVRIPRRAIALMQERLDQIGIDSSRPWIAVHPGASALSRRYPPESFATAVCSLSRDHGIQVLFTGSRGERDLVEAIRASCGVSTWSCAGDTSFEELAALLSLAPLLICNNTGPVHLAAAVGTPVVDLYALTNMQHAPWQVPHELLYHDVPCRNCYKSVCPEQHHNCLRLVSPEAVVAAALRLMKHARQPNGGFVSHESPTDSLLPALTTG